MAGSGCASRRDPAAPAGGIAGSVGPGQPGIALRNGIQWRAARGEGRRWICGQPRPVSLAAWLSQAGLPTTPPAHHHHHHQQQGASLRIQYKGSLPEGTFLLGRIRGHFYFGLTATAAVVATATARSLERRHGQGLLPVGQGLLAVATCRRMGQPGRRDCNPPSDTAARASPGWAVGTLRSVARPAKPGRAKPGRVRAGAGGICQTVC